MKGLAFLYVHYIHVRFDIELLRRPGREGSEVAEGKEVTSRVCDICGLVIKLVWKGANKSSVED